MIEAIVWAVLWFYGPIFGLLFIACELVKRFRPKWGPGAALAVWAPAAFLYAIALAEITKSLQQP